MLNLSYCFFLKRHPIRFLWISLIVQLVTAPQYRNKIHPKKALRPIVRGHIIVIRTWPAFNVFFIIEASKILRYLFFKQGGGLLSEVYFFLCMNGNVYFSYQGDIGKLWLFHSCTTFPFMEKYLLTLIFEKTTFPHLDNLFIQGKMYTLDRSYQICW